MSRFSSSNCSSNGGSGLLRAALAQGVAINNGSASPENNTTPTPSQMMSQLMGVLNNNGPMPNDLDLNLDSLQGGFEDCNVDEVIKHELSMDGSLDFNFSQQQLLQQQQQQQQQQLHHHHHHHHLHLQPHLHQQSTSAAAVSVNDFNLGFGHVASSNLNPNLLSDRSQSSSQPPLCSIAALAPGRSWVR